MKKAMFIITLVFLLLFTGCHSREVPDVASEMHSSVEAVEYATEEIVSSSEGNTSSEVEDAAELTEEADVESTAEATTLTESEPERNDLPQQTEPKETESVSSEPEVTVPKETTAPKAPETESTESKPTEPEPTKEPEVMTEPTVTEEPKATEPPETESTEPEEPKVSVPAEPEPEEAKELAPTEPTPTEPEPTEPPFDIDYWVSFAKSYASQIGLKVSSDATSCWDNPITAGAHCKYLERDITDRLNRYNRDEDITDVWIWATKRSDGSYDLYIGYA